MTASELRVMLRRLGWNQTQAAMRLGVRPNRVSEWCSGALRIPSWRALLLRQLERSEFAADLVPARGEPEPQGEPHPNGIGPLVVTLSTLREDGHKMRRHAFLRRVGTDRHKVWHASCECGWVSAKCTRSRDVDTLHVAHLRQIIAEWRAEQTARASRL